MVPKSDHDLLVEIHTVMMGSDGQDGLCRRVSVVEKKLQNMILVLTFLGGSGLIGTGIFELIRYIG